MAGALSCVGWLAIAGLRAVARLRTVAGLRTVARLRAVGGLGAVGRLRLSSPRVILSRITRVTWVIVAGGRLGVSRSPRIRLWLRSIVTLTLLISCLFLNEIIESINCSVIRSSLV